jgi:hypothetical protein
VARPQSLGHKVRPFWSSSIWAGESKPKARNAACIRAGPIASAIRAVTMLDEWTRVSGMLSGRPWGWSSLILNRPIGIGADAS